jgi:aromatic ring-opening dioxygenase LigB subunit
VPLVYACIAPHGGEIVPALAGRKAPIYAETTKAMRTIAREVGHASPDVIVVASPHNLRLQKHIGVVTSEFTSGKLAEGRREIKLRARCDIEFANEVVAAAEGKGLPVVSANYGALEGPMSDLAMDWGTLIPLWFMLKGTGLKSRVVIVTPSRGIPLSQNFEFGIAVAEAAEKGRKRVAFVASADQAHTHRKDGPYGFDRRAAEYDQKVIEAIRGGNLQTIMRMDHGFVEGAKPDSLWQLTMLAGAISVVPMEGEFLSYQAPTYFGMLCASFHPG